MGILEGAAALKGIELIAKLLPQLNALTGVKRQKFYLDFVRPMFRNVDKVNDFYNDIYLQLITEIKSSKNNSNSTADFLYGPNSSHAVEDAIRVSGAKENFLQQRKKDEGLRNSLRDEGSMYLSLIKWKEERRFFRSVVEYFIGEERTDKPRKWTDDEFDSDIAEALEKGSKAQWDTPSSALYHTIRTENDAEKLVEMVEQARIILIHKYMEVRRQYNQSRLAVLMNTYTKS